MLKYFVLGLFAVGALADTEVINEAVDELLDSVNSVLRDGQNTIALEDLDWDDTAKMFESWHLLFFKASGGSLQDLATLNRTGDVRLTTGETRMTLHIPIGFSSLSFGYSNYHFSFMSIKSNGSFNILTSRSSVAATIDVIKEDSNCSAEAGLAKLRTLGQGKIKFSGPEVLNQFLTTVLNRVLFKANIESKITKIVNAKLTDALKEGLAKTDICALLHYN